MIRIPGGAVTVTVNVSVTVRLLKGVVDAVHDLLIHVRRLTPDSIPMFTASARTVLRAALKQRSGTRSWRSVNVASCAPTGATRPTSERTSASGMHRASTFGTMEDGLRARSGVGERDLSPAHLLPPP